MQPGVAPLPHSGRRFSVSTREASSAHGADGQPPATGLWVFSAAERHAPRRRLCSAAPAHHVPHGTGFCTSRARRPVGDGPSHHGPAAPAPARRPCAHGPGRGPRAGPGARRSPLTVRPVPSTITSYSSFMAGQASAAARRKEKAQAASGRPADAGSARAGLGARGEGEVGRSGDAALASSEGGRHLRREAKSGAGARRRAATRASAAGAGLRRRSGAVHHALPPAHWPRLHRPPNLSPSPVLARRGRHAPLHGSGSLSGPWRARRGAGVAARGPSRAGGKRAGGRRVAPPARYARRRAAAEACPRPRGALGLRARAGHVGRNPPRRAWAGAGAGNAGGRRGPGPPPGVT